VAWLSSMELVNWFGGFTKLLISDVSERSWECVNTAQTFISYFVFIAMLFSRGGKTCMDFIFPSQFGKWMCVCVYMCVCMHLSLSCFWCSCDLAISWEEVITRKSVCGQFHNLYSSPDIVMVLRSRRVRWVEHVNHMIEMNSAPQILVRRGRNYLGDLGMRRRMH
jgi:hypothetical protein